MECEKCGLARLPSSSSVASEWQIRSILPPLGGRRREVVMKTIHWIIAAAALAFVQPVQAAQSDPEVIIYRFSGVRDNGLGFGAGIATVFFCTNFSGETENIRFVTRNSSTAIAGNSVGTIVHLGTMTAATHNPLIYVTNLSLNTGPIAQGTTAIAATSINIICTATTIDAAAATPIGVAL